MSVDVYCHHCEKRYTTTPEDIARMQRFDPEHFVVSGELYSYSGGCYFKTLGRLKRIEAGKPLPKELR